MERNLGRSKIAILGTGRVGLPLALFFRSRGHEVTGIDIDARVRDKVSARQMPFAEPGCAELLAQYGLTMTNDCAVVAEVDDIIVTVGTPLRPHIEADLSQVESAVMGLLPYLRAGHHLVLRSTVAPGTTAYVQRLLHQHTILRVGKDVALTFCPERLAEGMALDELGRIPQICGAEDRLSAARAQALFSAFGVDMMACDFVSAELAKLFCNIYRYVNFAVANQFALIADSHGADVHRILGLANPGYPRGPIPLPGLTAGTCLRKDFGMLNESNPYPDLLLSAWKINEYMPLFLVRHMQRRTPITGRKVAVLGYSFKKDADDIRDSLAPKLVRSIRRQNPAEVRICDPLLGPEVDGMPNLAPEAAVSGVDVVFMAANHSPFVRDLPQLAALMAPGAWIADLWNVGGIGRIFYRAAQVAMRRAA